MMSSHTVHQSQMPPFLSRFFHKFPHVNVTGHRVNATFDYNNQVYLESLGILASFPALVLILILVILLVYLLTRCCDRHAKRDRSFVCLKIILGLLGVATCASIGLGLYGNDDFHNGIETVVISLQIIQNNFNITSNQTVQAQASIENGLFPLMSRLGVVFEKPLSNRSTHVELLAQMTYMEGNITQTLEQISILYGDFQRVYERAGVHRIVHLIESIRWPCTLTLLIIFIIFCVVLFYAIVRHSRCCFITFSVLGLIAVILNWSLVSLYLVGAVSLADICINPSRAATSELLRGGISTELSDFYINCQPLVQETTDPFQDNLLQAQRSLERVQHTLRVLNSNALKVYSREQIETIIDGLFRELYIVEGYIGEISPRTDCQPIHGLWVKGVEGLCGVTLYGLSFLLLSSIITAFLFTLLVGLDSHTWIYIQKRKQCMSNGAEECVSFLPSGYGDRGGTGGTGRRTGGAGLNPYLINQTTHDWSCSSVLMEHEPTPLNGTRQVEYSGHHHHQGRMYETGTMGHTMLGPNNGQYATLSKQCKTLESNDFY